MSVVNTHKQSNAGEVKLTGYKLHKAWFSFALNNPDRVTPTQGILYLYCVELCNSLGWPKTFGLPAAIAMATTGIKSYNTYAKTFRELVEIGAIKLVAKSTNQYTANIIALSNFNEALDTAFNEASTEPHGEAPTSAIIAYKNNELKIAKPLNKIEAESSASMYAPDELNIDDYTHNLPESDTPTPIEEEIPPNGKFSKNNLASKGAKTESDVLQFRKPTLEEVAAYCTERSNDINPEQWLDYYTANGWKVGKNPMKDWKAAVRTWERNGVTNNSNNYGRTEKRSGSATGRHRENPGDATKKDYGPGTL